MYDTYALTCIPSSSFIDDARLQREAQGGMVVPPSLQRDMRTLLENRPGLKEKYGKLPFDD
jgi:hypothetical protein